MGVQEEGGLARPLRAAATAPGTPAADLLSREAAASSSDLCLVDILVRLIRGVSTLSVTQLPCLPACRCPPNITVTINLLTRSD